MQPLSTSEDDDRLAAAAVNTSCVEDEPLIENGDAPSVAARASRHTSPRVEYAIAAPSVGFSWPAVVFALLVGVLAGIGGSSVYNSSSLGSGVAMVSHDTTCLADRDSNASSTAEAAAGSSQSKAAAAKDPDAWPEHWKFYMYEPPHWMFRVFSRKERGINFGFGPKMADFVHQNVTINGQWATDHYTLEMLTRYRLYTSPHRTQDPNDAMFFYIPFHASEFIHAWKDEAFVAENGKAQDLYDKVSDFVLSKPFYNRTMGRDHVVTYGRMSDDGRIHGMKVFTNMTYISVETQIPYKCKGITPTACDFQKEDKFLPSRKGLIEGARYMHSVPYPSGYHLGPGVTRRFAYGMFDRPHLASAFFVNRLSFRNRIVQECAKSTKCVYQDSTNFKDVTIGMQKLVNIHLSSVFSIQPPGDSWSRRAYFDAIQHGCIPVFFDEFQYVNQWEWHMPHFEEISVKLPWEALHTNSTFDIVGALEKIPAEEVERKQRAIERLAPRTMWSVGGAGHPDGSPDAHDIMLRGIFELKERELKEEGFWPKERVDYWEDVNW